VGPYLEKKKMGQPPEAYACNPSYLEGRDQEDCGSISSQANSSKESYLENIQH
jgi:hypothetical protein